MRGHAEDASYAFDLLLYFIRSSAKIIYSSRLNFPFGLYDINYLNIFVKESFLCGILNAHNQMKKVFATKLFRFSYLFMLLLLGGDFKYVWDPKTRYQTSAIAEDLKLLIKM